MLIPGTRISVIPLLSVISILLIMWGAEALSFRTKAPRLGLIKTMPWPSQSTNPEAHRMSGLRDVSGRFLWGLASVLQVVVFLVVATYFVYVLSTRENYWTLIGVLICDAICALVVFYFSTTSPSRDPIGADFPGALLSRALDEVGDSDYVVAVNLQNSLTAAMMLLGILAIGSALDGGIEGKLSQGDMNEQVAQLRDLLTAATAALIIGVIQLHFEFRWVAGLFVNQNVKEGLEKTWEPATTMAASITLAAGGVFSLILLAAFFPAVVMLQRRVTSYNAATPANAIAFSWTDFSLDALKAIGPILAAGPLAVLGKG
jgi:hypothetical protein